MSAIERMKIELRRVQQAQQKCLSDYGVVRGAYRYRYQELVRKAAALKESIEWMVALYSEEGGVGRVNEAV